MLSRLLTFITSQKLISHQDTILLAVSGGLDSMVMLYCFNELKDQLDIDLKVVHVNHRIRGAESDGDEQLTAKQCERLKLSFFSKQLSGFDIHSSEEKLRDARYAAFNEWLQQFSHSKIATAHHLDDQVETFLMRLAKGSGVKGLLGIPVKRDRFIRPMLFADRLELSEFARTNNIPSNEDSTNLDDGKLRNHIRHAVIPQLLQVFGRSFYTGFEKSIAELNDVYKVFKEMSVSIFEKNVKSSEGSAEFAAEYYNTLQTGLRRELLKYCISSLIPVNFRVSVSLFHEFDDFAANAVTGSVFFIHGIKIYKNRSSVLFSVKYDDDLEAVELYPDQRIKFGDFLISLSPVDFKDIQFNSDRNDEYICSDNFKLPLIVRSWKEGDFFYPLGLAKKQKLSDFFVNDKIERPAKKLIPIICNADEIVWLAGLRLDERYKIQRDKKKYFRLMKYEER